MNTNTEKKHEYLLSQLTQLDQSMSRVEQIMDAILTNICESHRRLECPNEFAIYNERIVRLQRHLESQIEKQTRLLVELTKLPQLPTS